MKVYLGSDHAGYELKEKLKVYLSELGHEVEDGGPFSFIKTDDYPDFIKPVAEAVAGEKGSFGVILGYSGQGEAMCANRVPGARAAVFYGEVMPEGGTDSFEMIKLTREHNDANILSLGAHFITLDQAKFATELFLSTKFSGDERHVRRIKKLD
jgi:ribose 5-phosphate isomerase B